MRAFDDLPRNGTARQLQGNSRKFDEPSCAIFAFGFTFVGGSLHTIVGAGVLCFILLCPAIAIATVAAASAAAAAAALIIFFVGCCCIFQVVSCY